MPLRRREERLYEQAPYYGGEGEVIPPKIYKGIRVYWEDTSTGKEYDDPSAYKREMEEVRLQKAQLASESGAEKGNQLVGLLAICAIGYFAYTHRAGLLSLASAISSNGSGNAMAPVSGPGSDLNTSTQAPGDDAFTDTRGGRAWGDRCWNNILAGKIGWARSECLNGLAIAERDSNNPDAPSTRAVLLYDLATIELRVGDLTAAHEHLEQSLALREDSDTRTILLDVERLQSKASK